MKGFLYSKGFVAPPCAAVFEMTPRSQFINPNFGMFFYQSPKSPNMVSLSLTHKSLQLPVLHLQVSAYQQKDLA